MDKDKSFKEPGGIETPREEGQKEVLEETAELSDEEKPEDYEKEEVEGKDERDNTEDCDVPEGFTSEVTLSNELITTRSFSEIMNVFDNQVKAIREAAVKKVNEIRS